MTLAVAESERQLMPKILHINLNLNLTRLPNLLNTCLALASFTSSQGFTPSAASDHTAVS
eukprot:scaffold19744_cov140-Skeletonema_dohrnii-CCMP3373.AAC.2